MQVFVERFGGKFRRHSECVGVWLYQTSSGTRHRSLLSFQAWACAELLILLMHHFFSQGGDHSLIV